MRRRFTVLLLAVPLVVASHSSGCGSSSSSSSGARDGFADSSWPYPYSDLWRSSAAEDVGLPSGFESADLETKSAELPPLPFFGVTDEKGNLFVLGGSPFLLNLFTEAAAGDPPNKEASAIAEAIESYAESEVVPAYVARVDPSMSVTTIELPRGESVNYIGGLLAHENGKIYAVATSILFEIDPDSMGISRSLDLPLLEANPKFTSYNGLQVNPENGDIIVKASDFAGSSASLLISVRVDSLDIRTVTDVDVGTSRMTVASHDGKEYLYIPAATETERYVISDHGFELDEGWSKTYRSDDDGSIQATSMLYMGSYDNVVFADNDTIIYGVKAPLRIFSQSTISTTSNVTSQPAVSTSKPGGTFYMVAGDPFKTGIVVAQDAVNDIFAGWRLSENGDLTEVWENDEYATSAGPAIAVDQGHLYIDDSRCPSGGSECRNYLVVLDLESGNKVAEVEVAGEVASLGKIFLGRNNAYFISSEYGKPHGFVTRVDRR